MIFLAKLHYLEMNGLDINLSVYTNRIMNCQWKSYLEKNVRIRSFISIITRVMSLLSPASVAQQCRGCSLPRYDFFSVESAEECNIVAKSICKAFTFRHSMNAFNQHFSESKETSQ